MAERIYPEGLRSNCFAGMYCEIAMESYVNASNNFKVLSENNYSILYAYEHIEMDKNVIKTIVFSAMAIESFLNNYAAACLGDSEFYCNFDKLSTMSKFQLIAKFILKSEINKQSSCYYYLKSLFRLRDSYIHNKSSIEKIYGFSSVDEANEFIQITYGDELEEYEYHYNKDEINKDYKSALNALKAIKEMADYFDKYDGARIATPILFHPSGILCGSKKEKEYKTQVFSELNIKVDEML